MKAQSSKILVTGGAGFIGGNLVEELVKEGATVIVVDIKVSPLSIFALHGLKKKVSFENVDVRDRQKVFKVFKKYKPKYIFHFAAEPIVEKAFKSPYSMFETNVMGTVNILDAARSKKIKGIIVASSDKAYGKTEKAYTEESPLRGDHPYEVSKSCVDLICQSYFKTYNLPVVITRFGNVYGEGDLHFERIIPGICKAIINREVLRVRSDGSYVRDYIYVKDIVNGCITLLRKIDSIHGEAYNFSSPDNLSVMEVINRVEKLLGTKINYKILNIAKNEIPYQHLDDSKVRILGWRPTYSLTKTFPKILNWYKNIL